MLYKPLPRSFYNRDTHEVARELLGKLVVRRWRGGLLSGRITEVESYVGENDAACHAAVGKTKRNAVMFARAGHAYVYLIYGMYHCLNVVTDAPGYPAAVLVRSLEPVAGLASMTRARQTNQPGNLTNGPGKLTQALRITRAHNALDLVADRRLMIVDDGIRVRQDAIATSPRIGVDYAGADAALPWRYFLRDSVFVSGKVGATIQSER